MSDASLRWRLGWHPHAEHAADGSAISLYRGLGPRAEVRLPAAVVAALGAGSLPVEALESRRHAEFGQTRKQAVQLKRLFRNGFLVVILRQGAEALLHWQDAAQLAVPRRVAGKRLELARGTYVRWEGATLIVETPGVRGSVQSRHAEGQNLLWRALQAAASAAEAGAAVAPVIDLLACAGHLREGTGAEPAAGGLDQLAEWHETVFHHKWRLGNHHHPVGATYPGRADGMPPPPAQPPEARGKGLPLPRRSSPDAAHQDFFAVAARRRSGRQHGDTPMTRDQLGHLLDGVHHPASHDVVDADGVPLERVKRPTIAGGSLHELDLFVLSVRVEGLPAGFYYYAPDAHQLVPQELSAPQRNRLVREAQRASRYEGEPAVQLLLCSRLARLLWKYRAMAYALSLQNAGALQQMICLAATALDLTACSIGNGNSQHLAGCPAFAAGDRWWISSMLLDTRRAETAN